MASNEELLERVKKCKDQAGISYKTMYKMCGASVSVFYNFTGGIRELPERYREKLDQYLKAVGF